MGVTLRGLKVCGYLRGIRGLDQKGWPKTLTHGCGVDEPYYAPSAACGVAVGTLNRGCHHLVKHWARRPVSGIGTCWGE